MVESVQFSKEQIATFVNAETIESLAENMIKGYVSLGDCDELVIQMPLPRALYKAHLGNNYEEYCKQLAKACGEILQKHKLEVEK